MTYPSSLYVSYLDLGLLINKTCALRTSAPSTDAITRETLMKDPRPSQGRYRTMHPRNQDFLSSGSHSVMLISRKRNRRAKTCVGTEKQRLTAEGGQEGRADVARWGEGGRELSTGRRKAFVKRQRRRQRGRDPSWAVSERDR